MRSPRRRSRRAATSCSASGDAGAAAARVVRVDDTHLVLILDLASVKDADRVATDVGGPWMRERILPVLARGPQRSIGEVSASAAV
jgi:hypothetical protein